MTKMSDTKYKGMLEQAKMLATEHSPELILIKDRVGKKFDSIVEKIKSVKALEELESVLASFQRDLRKKHREGL